MITFGEKIGERMDTTAFDSFKGVIVDRIVDIPEDGFVSRFRNTIVMKVFQASYDMTGSWKSGCERQYRQSNWNMVDRRGLSTLMN